MRFIVCGFCLLAFCCLVSGCETTRGFGKDMENTGANIQQGIERVYNPGQDQ